MECFNPYKNVTTEIPGMSSRNAINEMVAWVCGLFRKGKAEYLHPTISNLHNEYFECSQNIVCKYDTVFHSSFF